MRARARAGWALVCVLAVLLVACTDEPEPDGDPEVETSESFGTKPDVATLLDPDRGDPPSTLHARDIVEGDGAEAVPGTVVTVHYVGARWDDGAEFDSTWEVEEPYVFELGAGRVIPGWERGIPGDGSEVPPMREGGRRMLTIPPEQAYGESGAGELIGPDETLVFVIDLLDVAEDPPS